jgi:SAM-dependent methyltransferase
VALLSAIKDTARVGLRRTGLSGPYFRARDRRQAARALRRHDRATAPDGLPLPSPELIEQVAGDDSAEEYLAGGERAEQDIRGMLRHGGFRLEELGAILDFGCGCGRVARRWATVQGPAFHGSDYNPALVAWCSENLPFLNASVNRLDPPLPYPDGRFDLIYALSVFTHLTEAQHHSWMHELRRVLRPGGLLIFTTHGDAHLGHYSEQELEAYRRGEFVVHNADMAGRNACGAVHPRSWVIDQLLAEFELLADVPQGGTGNGRQDIWLVRKPAGR